MKMQMRAKKKKKDMKQNTACCPFLSVSFDHNTRCFFSCCAHALSFSACRSIDIHVNIADQKTFIRPAHLVHPRTPELKQDPPPPPPTTTITTTNNHPPVSSTSSILTGAWLFGHEQSSTSRRTFSVLLASLWWDHCKTHPSEIRQKKHIASCIWTCRTSV